MANYTILDGRKVKAARESKGMTQQQVAAHLEAAENSVINWERPRDVRVQGRFARRLIKLLGMEDGYPA